MDDIKMSIKETEHLGIMKQIDQGTMNLRKAGEELGLSLRQTKRIRKRYLTYGERGVIFKKRGVKSANRIPEPIREKAKELLRVHFPDFGPTLAREKLEELYRVF